MIVADSALPILFRITPLFGKDPREEVNMEMRAMVKRYSIFILEPDNASREDAGTI